ncbi:MAG: ABC transporter ATP-binding protein [Caldilineaceae bacterium]|nr:ABC transporter ATP-binding protein [Caldilineaceae bacterium]
MLEVDKLHVAFFTDEGTVTAVDGVSFEVRSGRTLGIVGESGSGKSVTVNSVMRLLPASGKITHGSVRLHRANGDITDLTQLKSNSRQIREIRGGEIAMIFQEPMSSFSPVHTIGNHITEAILQHRNVSKNEAREIGIEMLSRVGISNPEQRFAQYPFELSGGMRQRAMIAVALSSQPALLIADEPTTALDVTIQAQILDLMRHLRDEFQMAIVFISHDLGVISQMADEIIVMYLGRVMERGSIKEVIRNPQHPYTRSLLESIPHLRNLGQRLTSIGGDIPSPLERPTGCPFHTRCTKVIAGVCDVREPAVTTFSPTHSVNCFLYE